MLLAVLIVFAFVGAWSIVVITIDIVFKVQKKLSHKRIISWDDRKQWEAAITKCAEKWLNKMPTIPLKDEERLIIIDILKKQYKHSALQNWQYAQLISGVYENGEKGKSSFNFKTFKITEIDDGYAVYQAWKAGMLDDSDAISLTEKFIDIVKKESKGMD
ncbi:hypothetical protein [Mediterraneibacter gnavus]|uniref:hypothetical protein n=1 Tax=Mediterraneibacter gnavus TaxID=33038 RepID=UPI0036D3F7B0